MDSKVMPEIIPMWISGKSSDAELERFQRRLLSPPGFDQIMNESRKFPRLVPRTGANISLTVGQPLTSRIQPLVDEWRALAAKEDGTLGLGGEWKPDSGEATSQEDAKQRQARGSGNLASGREQQVRVKITEILQEAVRSLGEEVEREEGKYDSDEWTQSRPYIHYKEPEAS
jgi:monolysocardiolipin acyltransferase